MSDSPHEEEQQQQHVQQHEEQLDEEQQPAAEEAPAEEQQPQEEEQPPQEEAPVEAEAEAEPEAEQQPAAEEGEAQPEAEQPAQEEVAAEEQPAEAEAVNEEAQQQEVQEGEAAAPSEEGAVAAEEAALAEEGGEAPAEEAQAAAEEEVVEGEAPVEEQAAPAEEEQPQAEEAPAEEQHVAEGEAPAEANLEEGAAQAEGEPQAEGEGEVVPQEEAAPAETEETLAATSSTGDEEKTAEAAPEETYASADGEGEVSSSVPAAIPREPWVYPDEIAAPDFTGLEGNDLLKAQKAYEHAVRLRELDIRLHEEEEEEEAALNMLRENRAQKRQQEAVSDDDDDERLFAVPVPPVDEDALERNKNDVELLRSSAADAPVPQVHAELEGVEDEAVVVDSITLEEIKSAEVALENNRVQQLRDDADGFVKRLDALKRRVIEATAREEKAHSDLLSDIAKRKALVGDSSTKWQEDQTKAFLKAQTYLAATIEAQKKLLTKEYGTLQTVPTIYPDGRVREKQQYRAPRLMSLKIDCLRAIKNKLMGGFYVVLVTLYDRLGGHPLRWCKLPDGSGHTHSAMTPTPQRHGGKYYNLELSFNQESNLLALACPSLSQARPSNVLVFELVSVRGGRYLNDRVVAWGAFPLMNANKTLIRGRFKVPLMRGEMNTQMDKYEQIQTRLTQDIDYWLCNLYFETNPIPLRANYKYLGLKTESLQYKIDKEAIMKGNYFKLNTSLGAGAGTQSRYSYGLADFSGVGSMGGAGAGQEDGAVPQRLSTPSLASGGDFNPFLPAKFQRGNAAGPARGSLAGGKLKENSLTGTGGDEFILPSDLLAGGANDLARKVAARERAKELRTYKYSITNPEADIPVDAGREKTRFLTAEMTGDLGLSRIQTLEFWTTIGMFILSWWLRIYVHYFGQYLWLTSSWRNNNAVYEFTIKPWTCRIKYELEPLNAVITQALVLVVGVVSNQICLLGLILFAWFFLRVVGSFSDAGFRFLLAFGICVMFDPISIAVVDAIDQNWDGDYFKIYNAYRDQNGQIGYAGAFLTITLAMILMCISFVILFVYLTQLHMNGRMLDVYHRLHSDEGQFFVPNDLELSVRTLRYILGKSKKWSGFHGTKRKVLLTAYIIDDHLDKSFHDRTLHLSIYNVTPKQGKRPEQRDIFRHFVRSSDGAITEAFDAAESMGADGYQKLEERWLSQEATSIDEQEAEAEDMLKHMLSDQKRADAEKSGLRQRGVKSLVSAVNGNGDSNGNQERSLSAGNAQVDMSVVQELSQERSEIDEQEEPQQAPPQEAALEHIGEEEQSEPEEE